MVTEVRCLKQLYWPVPLLAVVSFLRSFSVSEPSRAGPAPVHAVTPGPATDT